MNMSLIVLSTQGFSLSYIGIGVMAVAVVVAVAVGRSCRLRRSAITDRYEKWGKKQTNAKHQKQTFTLEI